MAADPVTSRRAEPVDGADVQALVLQGYGRLRAAAYVLLGVSAPAAARRWLADLLPEVSTGPGRPGGDAVNVAVTASGLSRLGLPDATLSGFSLEFLEGMTSPHRSRLLGDLGAAAPQHWAWGAPQGPPVDLMLLVFTLDEETLERRLEEHRRRAEEHGLQVLRTLSTHDLGRDEHFGFRDGLSQPVIAGQRGGAAMHTVRPGEFLLGYRNEHDELPRTPLVDPADDPGDVLGADVAGSPRKDLGRNGSYLVARSLSQDVGGFWGFLDQATRHPDGSSDPEARTALAARMVGRWPSGAPLTRTPDRDRPELAEDNDFGYDADDRAGLHCPIGAHVRRTNPRDSLPPRPGTPASLAVNRRHRLLRRGRPYGPPVDLETALRAGPGSDDVRGLHFLAVCADIARQFEFVTHTWALNPHFAGLYDDADPLLSGHQAQGTHFTVQATPLRRRVGDVPAFVTVRGGAYFFLPGIRALRYLSRLGEHG